MGYVIISDSTCDLTPELVGELKVKFMPFTFRIKGKEYSNYFDEREMKLKKFYEMLKEGEVATTSQLNVVFIQHYFRKYLKKKQDILYISFSSGLSGTFNSARLAIDDLKLEFPERTIEVMDSLCASAGQGLLVYQAAMNRNAGMSLRDNLSYCETYKKRIRHWFTVDDIDTLKRGGRLSASKALIAKVLNIKPVLNVDDGGHLQAVSKKAGRKSAIRQIVNNSIENIEIEEEFPTFISHANCLDEAMHAKELMEKLYEEKGVKSKIIITNIGPVIGAHAGPGTLAIFTIGDEREV